MFRLARDLGKAAARLRRPNGAPLKFALNDPKTNRQKWHHPGQSLTNTLILSTPAPAPFFIVGSGRSASTLLRMMLASHSRIRRIPPETWYLIPLLEELPVDCLLDAAQVEERAATS